MHPLRAVEIKAFVPAKDFALSKRFYKDLGFVEASDFEGVAYFHHAADRAERVMASNGSMKTDPLRNAAPQ